MKNMKIYNVLLAGFLVILGTSCSDSFLDVESLTESNTGNFYKTESDAYRALVGCYDGWQCTTSNEGIGFYLASEMMSDECFAGTGTGDARNYAVIDRFDQGQSSSDVNLFNDDWCNYYKAIYRCNELINRIDNIEWSTDGLRETYLGEALAIRALCYFDLVRLFERVPLLTVSTTDNVPQAEPAETYAQIVEDLKYAAENIPADAYPKSQASSNDGHITCYAAKALLARVYLFYSGYYGKEPEGLTKAEALQGLEDVIASGEYDLITAEGNVNETSAFGTLWPATSVTNTWTGEDSNSDFVGRGNKETVLSQKFNYTSDYNGNSDGNRWQVMIAMRNFLEVPYGQGWGACTVNPKLYQSYLTADTRRDASIIDMNKEGIEAANSIEGAEWREYTGYCIKKYSPLACWDDGTATNYVMSSYINADEYQLSPYQDFIVMRYADVLLMAAELGSSNGLDYLNQVRSRAFGGDASYNYGSVTTENIMSERMLEFAFEGQRYWDLLRQGVDYAASTIATTTTTQSGSVDDVVTIEAANITAKRGFCQIPSTQITLSNGVLEQNQGW